MRLAGLGERLAAIVDSAGEKGAQVVRDANIKPAAGMTLDPEHGLGRALGVKGTLTVDPKKTALVAAAVVEDGATRLGNLLRRHHNVEE